MSASASTSTLSTENRTFDDLKHNELISHLVINIIKPTVTSAFTTHKHSPEWLNVKLEELGHDDGIHCLIRIFAYRTGIAEFALLYNPRSDLPDSNRFVKLIIRSIEPIISESKHPATVCSILKMMVALATDLNIISIIVPDVIHLTPHSRDRIDLLMTLYTNQSLYSSLGFVLLNYPSLLTEIRKTLYTPLNELDIPTNIIDDLQSKMGISSHDTLNTLLYFVYPLYIDHTLSDIDKRILRQLYNILGESHPHIKQYTNVMVYIPYIYPRPGSHGTPPPVNQDILHHDIFNSVNVLKLMNNIDRSLPNWNFTKTHRISRGKTAKRVSKKTLSRSGK